jgi:copper chaperone CopZ
MLLGMLLALAADDTYTVTLTFEKMHCDECKAELESTLKKMQGVKTVAITENAAAATFEDKAPVPAFNRLPKDLKLMSATVSIRGTVSFAGDKATLAAKGSGQTLALTNPEKPRADRLAELKKQLGGKNRFQVTGQLVSGKAIAVETFQAADWKD